MSSPSRLFQNHNSNSIVNVSLEISDWHSAYSGETRTMASSVLKSCSGPVLGHACADSSKILYTIPHLIDTRLSKLYFSTQGGDGDLDSNPLGARAGGEDAGPFQDVEEKKSQESSGAKKPQGGGKKTKMAKSLQSAQERVAELLSPGKDTLMLHDDQSYELLGKAEDAPRVVAGASARAQEISPNRIHPHRLFYPGAKYSPEELNPYKAKEVLMRSDLTVRRGSIPKDVVKDQADFRNTEFLTYFLKDSGKLVPRRRTKLPAKLHRELMREIKLARSLGLVDYLSKGTVSKV